MKKATTIGAALVGLLFLGAAAWPQDPGRSQPQRGTLELSEEVLEALRAATAHHPSYGQKNDWTRALQGIHEGLQHAEHAKDADAARQALDKLEKAIMEARG